MLAAALFIIAGPWKQPRCLSTDDWMGKEDMTRIYKGILLSHKEEQIWVSWTEVDEPRACFTDWSKSEGKKQVSYINTHIEALEKWYGAPPCRAWRDTQRKRLWTQAWKEGVWTEKTRTDIYTVPCGQWTASGSCCTAQVRALWGPAAAAAAKSRQSCPTLCDPIDGSPPGSPVPGILQATTLEWVAISFSNASKWKGKVKLFSRVRLSATAWTAAHQAPPSMGFSRQEYWNGVPLPSPLWGPRQVIYGVRGEGGGGGSRGRGYMNTRKGFTMLHSRK